MIHQIRNSRLAGLTIAALLAALFVVAPVIGPPRPAAAETLPGTPNTALTSFWQTVGNRASCADWSGGDSVNQVRTDLTGDKTAWFFADSFLGSPDARHENGGFYYSTIHNSIVVQDGSNTHTITGGHTCHEADTGGDFFSHYANTAMTTTSCAFTDDSHCVDPFSWFWNSGVTAEFGGHLIDAFYYRVNPDGSGAFPFKVMNAMVAQIPTGDIFNDGDGILDNGSSENDINMYSLYCPGASEQVIWGADAQAFNTGFDVWGWGVQSHKLYYAKGDYGKGAKIYDLSTWQFRTSSGFSADCAQADPQTTFTVQSAFSVTSKNDSSAPDGVRYWLVQEEPGVTGSRILAYPADHPWSFPNKAVTLYDEPEGHHTSPTWTFTYDARVMPHEYTAGKFTVAYNVNTSGVDIGCGSRNKWDASIYRPRFIDVPWSALNPSAAVGVSSAAATTTAAADAGAKLLDNPPAGHGIRDIKRKRPPAGSLSPAAAPATGVVQSAATAPSAGVVQSTATAPPMRAVQSATATPGGQARSKDVTSLAADNTWYDSWDSAYDNNRHCPLLQNYTPILTGTNYPDGSVAMQWGDIGKDVWYWIYQRDVTLGQGFKRFELWSIEPTLTVNPITSKDVNGHTFAWYVLPFASQSPDSNGDGMPDVEGGASNNLQGQIWMQRPAAPSGVTASGYDFAAVKVTWGGVTYPTSDNFYWIYYWTSTTTATRVGPWGPSSRSAVVAPLARGQRYYFAVSAENLAGEGPPSATVSAVVP
jgi:hypothetical protein